jgi:aldose 1-epimerase
MIRCGFHFLNGRNKLNMKQNMIRPIIVVLGSLILSFTPNRKPHEDRNPYFSTIKKGIETLLWGERDDKKVYLYTLTNKHGMQVKITNYGCIVTAWIAPDKNGNKSNIVLGFDSLERYTAAVPYFGAVVGRYGNRIAKGQFTLDGAAYKLVTNNGPNHLHGGNKGFDKRVWDVLPIDKNKPSLTLHYLSKDGEEGYPGNLDITVKYTLTDKDELAIEYNATTDKATPVNLTNHSYFNLTADVRNTILNHMLWIDADNYTPTDNTSIPNGEIKQVKGTPFDFTSPHKVGERIDSLKNGYDNNFVLNKKSNVFKRVAYVFDSSSGRKLDVYTTEPGLQFYTGNFLNPSLKTSNGQSINRRTALCLETQHFPNSPNQLNFPNTILRSGEKFHSITKYKLNVNK